MGEQQQLDPQQFDLLRVCRIGRAQGLHGEVNIQVFTDEPAYRFTPGSQLFDSQGTTYTVASCRTFKQRWIIRLEGVQDRNASESLQGLTLYVPADDAEELESQDTWYAKDLVGLRVRMAAGNRLNLPEGQEVGVVRDVLDGVAQNLLCVQTAREPEALIPFIEQFVPEINLEHGYLSIDPPVGLLDL